MYAQSVRTKPPGTLRVCYMLFPATPEVQPSVGQDGAGEYCEVKGGQI